MSSRTSRRAPEDVSRLQRAILDLAWLVSRGQTRPRYVQHVNRALAAVGVRERLAHDQERGFYFSGGRAPEEVAVVHAGRLEDMTIEEWVDLCLRTFRKASGQ